MSEDAFLRRLNSSLPKERRRPLPTTSACAPEEHSGPSTEDAVNALDALHGTAYTQQVAGHLGQEHDAQWHLYLHPRLRHRTRAALIRRRALALRSLQDTADGRAATRARIRSFLRLLEQRLQQAEDTIGDDPLAIQRRAVHKLAAAIRAHRNTALAQGVEPEPWDRQLWNAVDELDASGDHADLTETDDRDTRTA